MVGKKGKHVPSNSHQGLILLMSSLILPFTVLTLVSFIKQVPSEIEEAAMIDGVTTLQMLRRIVLLLIRPALVTMFIISFIIIWNELLYPSVFAQRSDTRPRSVGLMDLSPDASSYTCHRDMISAMSVVMIIPIFLVGAVRSASDFRQSCARRDKIGSKRSKNSV